MYQFKLSSWRRHGSVWPSGWHLMQPGHSMVEYVIQSLRPVAGVQDWLRGSHLFPQLQFSTSRMTRSFSLKRHLRASSGSSFKGRLQIKICSPVCRTLQVGHSNSIKDEHLREYLAHEVLCLSQRAYDDFPCPLRHQAEWFTKHVLGNLVGHKIHSMFAGSFKQDQASQFHSPHKIFSYRFFGKGIYLQKNINFIPKTMI